MKRLQPEASDEEILAAVREWIGLLADRRYVEAHTWLHHGDPTRWPSPEIIATVIRNYGFVEPRTDGRVFQVTPIETASQGEGGALNVSQSVDRFDDGHRGVVHFDLPLNGVWSDVTAILEFSEVDGALVFDLDDIHVM